MMYRLRLTFQVQLRIGAMTIYTLLGTKSGQDI